MSSTIENIHCKVSYDGQIRRFPFVGTEFTSLKETIAKLANVQGEFVLKYRDDESDYVTLDNQEDLKTAFMITPTLLRITVETTDAPSCPSIPLERTNTPACHSTLPETTIFPSCPSVVPEETKTPSCPSIPPETTVTPSCPSIPLETTNSSCPASLEHHKRSHHHHHHKKDHHDYHHKKDRCHDHHHQKTASSFESRRLRVEKKLIFINQCLTDLGVDESKLTPRDLWRKKKLVKQQQRLESFFNNEGKCQKREKRIFTPEEQQFNCGIKLQMLAIKSEVAKLKERKREIKVLLQEKPGHQELRNELKALKEKKQLFKAQRKALCDKLHS